MAQQDLRVYYNYLYPFDTLVKWLTHNNKSQLAHRELSFQYEGVGVERYVTFANAEAMKARMIDRHSKIPMKVDAGAIWDRTPEKDSNGKTIQRELIFDFDMNDYDDVRTCCTGKTVCVKCWKLLIIAVEIIEKALAEDFGFTQLMFVFSGGRGLHIWVCDKRAMELKDSVRKALVDYLQLVTGNVKAQSLLAEKVISNVDLKSARNGSRQEVKLYFKQHFISQHVDRSLKILQDHFLEIMIEQEAFTNEKCISLMLKIVGNRNEKLKERVNEKWLRMKGRSASDLFDALRQEVCKYQSSITAVDYQLGRESDKIYRLTFIEQQIMLSFLYPRIDHNVSTSQNHLLKLPFSVHPTSKKISIPLFKNQLQTFDPKNCVNIVGLLGELEGLRQDNKLTPQNETNALYTHLRQPIQAMKDFIATLQ